MENLFDPNSRLSRFLAELGDLILLNLLCLLCCLPIVTAGAAIAATHKLLQDKVMHTGGRILRPFFQAFHANFKQATVVWLMLLGITLALLFNLSMVTRHWEGSLRMAAYGVMGLLAVIVSSTAVFLFPLLCRYRNAMSQHLSNALILAACKFPRALCMILLHASPLLLFILEPVVFLKSLVFWLLLGVALIFYLDNLLLRPVYLELEQ